MRENPKLKWTSGKKVLVEVSKFRVFAQLYVSRGKNAADIDESLPRLEALSRPESSFDRSLQENAVNSAPGVLCSLCGQVAELSLRRRAVDI